MSNIWQNLPKPFFVLAPMEAVTDVVFRHVVEEASAPDLYMTEFTNATGWVAAGDRAIGGRLVKTDDETNLIAQLWGADPDAIKQLSIHCKKMGFAGIDINMGCPDKSAVKAGGGAGMIRTPELAAKVIEAAKESELPVSVKTRLGYSRIDEWSDWLGFLLEQDIVNLTIHLRSKKEMSKVPAHFELIPQIIELRNEVSPDTLLTINGDIEDREHGLQIIADNPGVDGIMIGRGVFHNPFTFAKNPANINKSPLELLRLQLSLYDKYSEKTLRPYDTLKRFFKIYIRDFDGAAEVRDKLMHTKTTDEVREILASIQ